MQVSKDGTDRRIVISAAWIFVVLNYIYADIFILMGGHGPATAEEAELVNTLSSPEMFVVAAIFLQMAMVMIILSRVLRYGINRWANIIIATVHTIGVLASLFVVTNAIYYIYFVMVEVITLLFIVWYAWSWKTVYE